MTTLMDGIEQQSLFAGRAVTMDVSVGPGSRYRVLAEKLPWRELGIEANRWRAENVDVDNGRPLERMMGRLPSLMVYDRGGDGPVNHAALAEQKIRHNGIFRKGKSVAARPRAQHGSRGPPGAGVVGGVDCDDQASALWLQPAEGQDIGRVRLEGPCGDPGCKSGAVREGLDVGDGADGDTKRMQGKKQRIWEDQIINSEAIVSGNENTRCDARVFMA